LAQLRQDYTQFTDLDAEIIAIAPDTMGNAQSFFRANQLPFPGLVDDELAVYQMFDVQSKLSSLGQRPGLFIIDKQGVIRFAYLGTQMWEIPENLEVLDQLQLL
jgi:peroxiredoxin Q/BCP